MLFRSKMGKIDLISLDATIKKSNKETSHHMDYQTAKDLFFKLKECKIAGDDTIKVVNHFSHNNSATYDDLKAVADKDGIIVSYDGLEIEF